MKRCSVVVWELERRSYGTRQDKKAGGDAEAAAREGGDEAAEGRRHAEGHGIPSAVLDAPPQGFLPAKPLARKPIFVLTIARYVTYSNM